MALALPDRDEVSGGLCLQQAEVEVDAMADGHGDQPDTVLGAGVWTGEARGVHGAIGRGDVPTAGDCREGTRTQVSAGDHLPPENSDDFLMKFQLPAQTTLFSRRSGRMGRGDRAWLPPQLPIRPRSSGQVLLWACSSLPPPFFFLMDDTCPGGRTHYSSPLSFPGNGRQMLELQYFCREELRKS